MYSSALRAVSPTKRAPQNPSSTSRSTSWRMPRSFNDFRSRVYDGMITLAAPRIVDQAQSRASRLVNGGTAPLRGRVDFSRISNIFYNPGLDKRAARGDET